MKLNGRWFLHIVDRDSGCSCFLHVLCYFQKFEETKLWGGGGGVKRERNSFDFFFSFHAFSAFYAISFFLEILKSAPSLTG